MILIVFCKSFLADRIGTAASLCDLNVRMCTNYCIYRVNGGGSVAETSWLACAAGAGVIVSSSIPARFARAVELKVPGDFCFLC